MPISDLSRTIERNRRLNDDALFHFGQHEKEKENNKRSPDISVLREAAKLTTESNHRIRKKAGVEIQLRKCKETEETVCAVRR